MILCIGTTPAAQRVMRFASLSLNEVNRAIHTDDGAAGKSINTAKVLKSLGAHPLAVGFLGGDRGAFIRDTLRGLQIEEAFVTVNARTRECVTVLDQSAATTTELVEENGPITVPEIEALLSIVQQKISGCRAMVMSGTLAPGVDDDFYQQCVALGKRQGILTVVDAKGPPLTSALKAAPDLIKPNLSELAATVGRTLNGNKEVADAMRTLRIQGATRVVVTAGESTVLACEGEVLWKITPPKVAAVNPIGSGDAFTAALTWRLLQGDDLGEACRWGTACGTVNALSLLAGEVSLMEVERLVPQVQVERLAE